MISRHPETPAGFLDLALGQSFPRVARLRKRWEFERVNRLAVRSYSRSFIVLWYEAADGSSRPRLGVTVSRKVGSAVRRNRLKRLIREFFRTHFQFLPASSILCVIARRGAAEQSATLLRRELERLFRQGRGGQGLGYDAQTSGSAD